LAAVAFHLAITIAETALIERAFEAPGRTWMGWVIVTPVLGALASGALLQYVFPNARGSGIPQVKAAFAQRGRRVRFRDSVAKFLIGTLQIGSGSSLGREGPTVQICAGIAQILGRVARVSPKAQRRLLPVGAAAGVAAAFNAPIAAVTFTIEEVVGNLDSSVLSGVIVAAALAAVIERSVLGEHPVFTVPHGYGLQHASSLLLYAALGIAAAAMAIAFTDGLIKVRQYFKGVHKLPKWAQPAIGGIVTGVLAVLAFALLETRGVTGGGYHTLSAALAGKVALKTMIALGVMKLIATVFSYSSGGAGGIFAPSLFMGGMLGGAFGMLDVYLFDHEPQTIGAFALVGMGAVFSGTIRAPMTSVLIIIEMTNGYELILPLMIANMTAFVLARRFRPVPVYEALLEQDGIHLHDTEVLEALEDMPLGKLVAKDADCVTFKITMRAQDLVRAPLSQEVFPVLGPDGKMVGVITTEELKMLEDEPDLGLIVCAADIMRPPAFVRTKDDVRMAMEAMIHHRIRRIPVLDQDDELAGFVDEAALARVYFQRTALKKQQDETSAAADPEKREAERTSMRPSGT
ncbi:MAG: chloride channel protein, partial [Polyangiaceae bacterium]